MPAIEVNHLTKEFRLGAVEGLKQTLLNTGARLIGRPVAERPLFKALDDVSFSIEQGEVVGIIGHNGAGKSTLLKMLAKISTPTHGEVKINGRIAPLIEVGAGFVPDFTGRENVYLNGAILGMSKQEIAQKFDEIVEFAEIEAFIDTPVKRYSSGMQVKLAFAVATSIESEILIVDEVLAVGDLAFQRKCFDRMEELIKNQGRTVLLVSHNIRQVERLCSRVILMDHGRAIHDGDPEVACNLFYEQNDRKVKEEAARRVSRGGGMSSTFSSGELELQRVSITNADGEETDAVVYGEAVTITLSFVAKSAIENLAVGVGVHTPDLLYIANDDSSSSKLGPLSVPAGLFQIIYRIACFPLYAGTYALRIGAATADADRPLFYGENLCHFQVVAGAYNQSRTVGQGFLSLGGDWAVLHDSEEACA